MTEDVVLVDAWGRAAGTADKRNVHGAATPLHVGFSCYVIDASGRLLLTQRAASKTTWPGVWTNSCCGHPAPGESLRDAVTRRLRHELGLVPRRMALAIADFAYRAVMDDGVAEHEICPVVVVEAGGPPALNPDEVDDATWVTWESVCDRARRSPSSLSPWSSAQITELEALGDLSELLDRRAASHPVLDRPVTGGPDTGRAGEAAAAAEPTAAEVDEILVKFVDARIVEFADVDPALAELTGEVEQLLRAGGKRLRPAFVHWGHRATGAEPMPGLAAIGAAVEMLHTFALLHDDVMDRSPVRRNQPAAAHRFRAHHETARLEGDGRWFGVSAAVLAGDLAFAWANQLLGQAVLPSDARDDVHRVFSTLCSEVMAGQYLDLRGRGHTVGGAAAARRVALLKSGRYTITRPLQLGLAAAGVTGGPQHRALTTYGDALGVAFQLRDDVLGVFGDPARLGKECDRDLREGKRTLLVERALGMADRSQRAALGAALGNSDLSEEQAAAARRAIAECGALAAVETAIRALREEALAATRSLDPEVQSALQSLVDLVVDRDR